MIGEREGVNGATGPGAAAAVAAEAKGLRGIINRDRYC